MLDLNTLALQNPYETFSEAYWQWAIGFWAVFDEAVGIYSGPTEEELRQPIFVEGYTFGAVYAGLAGTAKIDSVPLELVFPRENQTLSDVKIEALAALIRATGSYKPIKVKWQYQSVPPLWSLAVLEGEDTWYALKQLGHDQVEVVFGTPHA